MKTLPEIQLSDIQQVYAGPEGRLWELIMGEQIHIGGLVSSMDLADRARIAEGTTGVDFCCHSGAGMRFLIRFRGVARMFGVDATEDAIDLGRRRCAAEGVDDMIEFWRADVCKTELTSASFDFVWSEDALCYVADKDRMIAEAERLLKPGGTMAFTDWVEGPAGLADDEAERLLRFMKFPSLQSIDGYREALAEKLFDIEVAEDTGRFASYVDLYLDMLNKQLTYDALKIIDFNSDSLEAMGGEMEFMRQLAHDGKIAQGIFVAKKRA